MKKIEIEVDDHVLPEDWEVSCALPSSSISVSSDARGPYRQSSVTLICRPVWKAPEFLKPGWIWSNDGRVWQWSNREPEWRGFGRGNVWSSVTTDSNGICDCISRTWLAFIPPPWTDAESSLREIK